MGLFVTIGGAQSGVGRVELFEEKVEPAAEERQDRAVLRRLAQTYCVQLRSIHSDSGSLAFFGVLGVLWRFHS